MWFLGKTLWSVLTLIASLFIFNLVNKNKGRYKYYLSFEEYDLFFALFQGLDLYTKVLEGVEKWQKKFQQVNVLY